MTATASPDITFPRLRIGVSSCLLGNAVRYDGNHKRQPWLIEQLGRYADFAPYCPEMAIGLGVPREPIQLYGDPDNPRVRLDLGYYQLWAYRDIDKALAEGDAPARVEQPKAAEKKPAG